MKTILPSGDDLDVGDLQDAMATLMRLLEAVRSGDEVTARLLTFPATLDRGPSAQDWVAWIRDSIEAVVGDIARAVPSWTVRIIGGVDMPMVAFMVVAQPEDALGYTELPPGPTTAYPAGLVPTAQGWRFWGHADMERFNAARTVVLVPPPSGPVH